MRVPVVLAAVLGLLSWNALLHAADANPALTQELIQSLLDQGVSRERILGVDPHGIPLVSGPVRRAEPSRLSIPHVRSIQLPAGTRGWESVPGVIRNDGLETFRVEVDANGPVTRVTMTGVAANLIPAQAPPFDLRDDGLGGDRVAGDGVFTSGPFTYDTAFPMRPFYLGDTASPAGLDASDVGSLWIEELDGTTTQFLINPKVGLLRSDIPAATTVALSSDVVVSPHLVNVRSSARETQSLLRFLPSDLPSLTNRIYEVLPDVFDFFMFFSLYKVERLPQLSAPNFTAGVHESAKVSYTGTGQGLFDNTAMFGSGGRLLGLNVLDTYERGIVSNNSTHEIVHQWSSFTDLLGDGTGHYMYRSSVGSLVGGFRWNDNGDGTFTRDCDEGRNGAHRAPPLDKYMMGLIDGAEVAPLHVDLGTATMCLFDNTVNDFASVTIDDIQRAHGIRTPGPAAAQSDFRIGFVAESRDRLLNPTEMTFYETLAAHYTRAVLPGDPDPYVGFNWAPITRFFGEGTMWRSDVMQTSNGGTLDVDASLTVTRYDALTDGLLAIRYLSGLTGDALTTGAVGPTATRTEPAAIKTYLDAIRPLLDIDGNGAADALTDGLLIQRYLFGLRGNALISGALDPLATRTTATAIEAYIQTLIP